MRLEAEPANEFARAPLGNGRINAPQPGDEFEIFVRGELVIDHWLVGEPRRYLLCGNRIGERVDPANAD